MLILPAIDLRGGYCVRLSQGDYARETIYDSDPVRVALDFEVQGGQFLHVVDLDGAKSGIPENLDAVRAIVRAVRMKVEVGGGVRSLESARALLDVGVARVVVGSKLVHDPELAHLLFTELGDRVVAGIDARDGKVAVSGWTETSSIDAVDLAEKMVSAGCRRIILTDIERDGMLTGPNLEFLEKVSAAVNIPIIQSGGIGSLDHIRQVAGSTAEGVIVGRALYEGKFLLHEAIAAVPA